MMCPADSNSCLRISFNSNPAWSAPTTIFTYYSPVND
jgi:hypothetical protein